MNPLIDIGPTHRCIRKEKMSNACATAGFPMREISSIAAANVFRCGRPVFSLGQASICSRLSDAAAKTSPGIFGGQGNSESVEKA